ncbi:hypothetical protein A9P82_02500 [Arachidicoccus ginsenosidimutans]|nr:hypothetical protein A9P82_02500 [Arachidicoccus sp. BS20]
MGNFKSLEDKIKARIKRMKSNVFIREDFADLGGYDQVGRVLLKLTRQGNLAKLGYGIYAKAKTSQLTGELVPVAPLPALAKEALQKLGVKTLPTNAEKDYQEGRSTQIPTGRLIGIEKSRLSRKIGYKEATIYYERV